MFIKRRSLSVAGWANFSLQYRPKQLRKISSTEHQQASRSILRKVTGSFQQGIALVSLRWPAGLRLNALLVWTYYSRENLRLSSRSRNKRKGSRESSKCLSDCLGSSLNEQACYAKKNRIIRSITITSTSRSTSRNAKTFASRSGGARKTRVGACRFQRASRNARTQNSRY